MPVFFDDVKNKLKKETKKEVKNKPSSASR